MGDLTQLGHFTRSKLPIFEIPTPTDFYYSVIIDKFFWKALAQ